MTVSIQILMFFVPSRTWACWQVGGSFGLAASRETFHLEHSVHTSDCEQQGNDSKVCGVDEKLKSKVRILALWMMTYK